MRVYVVEKHFRDRLVIPFTVTLLELFENRETGLEFCKKFIENSKQNSKKDGINIVTVKTNTDKDLICNSRVGNFEFLCGYWKEIKKDVMEVFYNGN